MKPCNRTNPSPVGLYALASGICKGTSTLLLVAILWAGPATLAIARPAAEALSHIQRLIAGSPAGVTAIYIVDGPSGQVLLNNQGEEPVIPASNQKVLTTAAALTLLGPEYKFVTRVLHDGSISGGTLQGNLIVYGGGDPTISGRFGTDKRDVTYIMRQWAEELKKKGIRSIQGDIVGDDSFFDAEYFHPAWPGVERGEWYSAEVSALAFNDNCVDLSWSSRGQLPGDIAKFTMNPKTTYVTLSNDVKVAAQGRSVERYYERGATSNQIRATGTMAYNSTKEDSAAIHNGALYFCSVFRDVLNDNGIIVKGQARLHRGAARSGRELIVHQSPSLAQICKIINQNSQNFYAESVTKSLGALKKETGSWPVGASVVEEFCQIVGIYNTGHQTVDGSGLSNRNRTTVRQLVEVLRYMDSGQVKSAWRSTLPQGGASGSLRSRFQGTPTGKKVASRIYAKTGLIGGVRSLSGYTSTQGGRDIYFGAILNRLPSSAGSQGISLLDNIAIALSEID